MNDYASNSELLKSLSCKSIKQFIIGIRSTKFWHKIHLIIKPFEATSELGTLEHNYSPVSYWTCYIFTAFFVKRMELKILANLISLKTCNFLARTTHYQNSLNQSNFINLLFLSQVL